MLVAKNLSKKYGQLTVLNEVSLNINKGAFVAICGPSGAGKSTLLHLLGGLDNPDTGEVFLLKEQIFKLSQKKQYSFRNKNIGFIFQFHHLLPEFTALENVAMPLWISGISDKEAEQKATEMLEIVGLKNRLITSNIYPTK